MVLVLSGFNGIEQVIEDLYSAFDPEIRITKTKGKTLVPHDELIQRIKSVEGVEYVAPYIEETTILKNEDRETWVIARMKGITQDYLDRMEMEPFVIEGGTFIEQNGYPYAILGSGLMHELQAFVQISDQSLPELIKVVGLMGDEKLSKSRENAIRDSMVTISGRFLINPKYDESYFLVPIDFAANLVDYNNEVTGLELILSESAEQDEVKAKLKEVLGDDYFVQDKFDQNELLFKTHESEKWITFLILCFIFVLSTFNMIASLTMLVLDKRQDIGTLKSMGAHLSTVRRIFIYEGLLINFIGAISGIVIGLLIAFGQMQFGWVSIGGDAIVEAYPVRIVWWDLIWIFVMVLVVGILSTFLPVRYLLSKKKINW